MKRINLKKGFIEQYEFNQITLHAYQTNDPVEYTASIISNKWKVLILRDPFTRTKRYSELFHSLIGISAKVLTQNLRDLEKDGIISKIVYPVVPPKVEYLLTEKGNELKLILYAMKDFGLKYQEKLE